MKRILLMLCIGLLSTIALKSQDISYSFSSTHSCLFSSLDSVIIENITQGGDTVLYYPDTVLTFNFTGVDLLSTNPFEFCTIQNYPNPFESNTQIDIYVPEKDLFTINIFDVSGKIIINSQNILEKGLHRFSFNGGMGIFYVLRVNSNKHFQEIKMVQLNNHINNTPQLCYNGVISKDFNTTKSLKSYFQYNIGDELKFTGYANGDYETTIDSPVSSEVYIFEIANNPPTNIFTGIHIALENQIEWHWTTSTNAIGYRYNFIDDYTTSIESITETTFLQTNLICDSSYVLYVWAYNECGASSPLALEENTDFCGDPCPNMSSFIDSRDGNTYHAVQIGDQCWMSSNLKYLPAVYDSTNISMTAQRYYVYGYNGTNISAAKATFNYNTYGVLYNWPAIMSGSPSSNSNPSGVQGICPSGWHLPSDAEWMQLELQLGISQEEIDALNWRGTNEGGKLKSSNGWNSPNIGANNSTGFSALPGGHLFVSTTIHFNNLGDMSDFWSTTEPNANSIYFRRLQNEYTQIGRGTRNANNALSVRCVLN